MPKYQPKFLHLVLKISLFKMSFKKINACFECIRMCIWLELNCHALRRTFIHKLEYKVTPAHLFRADNILFIRQTLSTFSMDVNHKLVPRFKTAFCFLGGFRNISWEHTFFKLVSCLCSCPFPSNSLSMVCNESYFFKVKSFIQLSINRDVFSPKMCYDTRCHLQKLVLRYLPKLILTFQVTRKTKKLLHRLA